MKIYGDRDNLPAFTRPAVTVGSFDGVHAAHRMLLDALRREAAGRDGESVVVTFWPHPRFVLEGEACPMRLLNTFSEKLLLLRQEGIDNVVVVPFTRQFSLTPPAEFEKWLREGLGAEALIAGYNHHFGHNQDGRAANLAKDPEAQGMEVRVVGRMELNGAKVSSSAIREMIARGDISGAARMLGYPYFIIGRTVGTRSPQVGEGLRIEPEDPRKLLPPQGEYGVTFTPCDPERISADGICNPDGGRQATLRITADGEALLLAADRASDTGIPSEIPQNILISFSSTTD